MSNKLHRTAWALATVGLALVTFVAGTRLGYLVQPPAQPVAVRQIVLAARELPAGQPIAADQLRRRPARPDEHGFDTLEPLIGRTPTRAIAAGALPAEADFSASALADELAPGERALAISVDEIKAVGNRLQRGDMVDVFLTVERNDREVARSESLRIASGLRVLAFGNRDQTEARGGAAQERARSAVLAVPLDTVATLTLAQQAGQLTLGLRGRHAGHDAPSPQTVAGLLGTPPQPLAAQSVPVATPDVAPRPARVKLETNQVEVLRGKGRS
ncbi:Flp pilus assembly protein CpaB [Chitiniphilus eburneus]|uniref:Flp pilus assembly protein CpaB n=1 Tax=Chitiniphilus eburneus TaxID=2571148 RepID=UPI0035CF2B5A